MKTAMPQKETFNAFTGKYALSKTLRFELRPDDSTRRFLQEDRIIELDKDRRDRYEKTKPFFDRLHQEFISAALSDTRLISIEGYDEIYRDWKGERDRKEKRNKYKILEKKEEVIRKEIVELFNKKANEWLQKMVHEESGKEGDDEKSPIDRLFFKVAVFSILKKKYAEEPEAKIENEDTGNYKTIFDDWKDWTAYFKKFFETRKNFYVSNGTAAAVATRMVNDNLRRFCENGVFFEKIKTKIDLAQLEMDFGSSIDHVFQLKDYCRYLCQNGIDSYNALIGGEERDGRKVKGLNEYLNEHWQKTDEKLPHLKQLDSQIGSKKEDFIDLIQDDDQLKKQLTILLDDARTKVEVFHRCIAMLLEGRVNLARVYFRKEAVNTIMRRWFESHEKFADAIVYACKKEGENKAKYDPQKEEYNFPDFISWHVLQMALEKMADDKDEIWKERYRGNIPLEGRAIDQQFLAVFKFEYESILSNGHTEDGESFVDLAAGLELLLGPEALLKNEDHTETIKAFCDRVLSMYRFAKYFSLEKSRQWNPDGLDTDDFYDIYEQFYRDSYEKIVKAYDRIRNYLTQKPFNQDKWLLNFENPTLADGWDRNKETANKAVILRKDGRYYLGVMKKSSNTIFETNDRFGVGYEKMVYKFLPDPSKMMPKVCFSKERRDLFKPSKEIIDVYENAEFKKGDTFSVASMQKLIDFYKEALTVYDGWKMYSFKNLKDTNRYTKNIGEFYADVANDGYRVTFEQISEEYIQNMSQTGRLYLFEIHNKDWNYDVGGTVKSGKKNVHTLYFEQLFSDENASSNFVIKLNGEAEIFFRPATNREKLGERKDKSGKTVTKNKRYAEDKLFFHVPITLNRTASDANRFNEAINAVLANNPDINIIGIDRGEKHLAYLSVINQKGEILETRSLNTINGVPYAQLLEERSKNREKARRDWKNVEQIKDLKKGYISHVVHEIADLIIRYNAIVVLEDLNMRFKQVRGGIEKSVYQQLEKALINKLNFLVDKNETDPGRAGHVLRAYQLTAPFSTFREMGKQTGVLFYTQAEYTSQTDPVKGFRKNVYISNSATCDTIKEVIRKFDKIGWDDERKSYYFTYNPIDFVDSKSKETGFSKAWKVYANVPRIRRERKRGNWEATPVNPNSELVKLFHLWEFDSPLGFDMKDQIFQMDEEGRLNGAKEFDGKRRNFWQSFIFLFNLILQVRNSTPTQYKKDDEGRIIETIEGVDFIASPVEPFFATSGGKFTEDRVNLAGLESKYRGDSVDKFKSEYNGDANGAYNIARKGIMILDRISKNPEKPETFISKKEWDEFATTSGL